MVSLISTLKENIRLIVQIGFTVMSNGYAKGFAEGSIYQGDLKAVCVPGLNCYACPGALGSCPIGALQAVLGSSNYKFPFYVVGFLFAFGAVFGRFVCGWLCPFGLVQDMLHKIPFLQKVKNLPGHKYLKYVRYVVLALFVIILPLIVLDIIGQGSPWFCKWICPSGTLSGGWTLSLINPAIGDAIGWLFTWKSFVLIAILALSIYSYRPFCKYLCPLGVIYGAFNFIAFYRYKVDKEKCIDCGGCQETCPMNIEVYNKPNSMECIRCGRCMKACPQGAISSTVSNAVEKFAKQ